MGEGHAPQPRASLDLTSEQRPRRAEQSRENCQKACGLRQSARGGGWPGRWLDSWLDSWLDCWPDTDGGISSGRRQADAASPSRGAKLRPASGGSAGVVAASARGGGTKLGAPASSRMEGKRSTSSTSAADARPATAMPGAETRSGTRLARSYCECLHLLRGGLRVGGKGKDWGKPRRTRRLQCGCVLAPQVVLAQQVAVVRVCHYHLQEWVAWGRGRVHHASAMRRPWTHHARTHAHILVHSTRHPTVSAARPSSRSLVSSRPT